MNYLSMQWFSYFRAAKDRLAVVVGVHEWMLSRRAIEFLQWVHPVGWLLARRFEQIIPQSRAGPGVALLREVEAVERKQTQVAFAINVKLHGGEKKVKSYWTLSNLFASNAHKVMKFTAQLWAYRGIGRIITETLVDQGWYITANSSRPRNSFSFATSSSTLMNCRWIFCHLQWHKHEMLREETAHEDESSRVESTIDEHGKTRGVMV